MALDSGFVQPWARIAAIRISKFATLPSAGTLEAASNAVKTVERLAQGSPIAHRMRAAYLRDINKDSRAAYDELIAAGRSDPNNADVLTATGQTENTLGLFDSALVHIQRAAQLDPKSASTRRYLAATLGYLRRFPESIEQLNKLLAMNPANLDAAQAKVRAQVLLGDMAGARRTIHELLGKVDSITVGIRFAYYQEMMWVLDDAILRKVAAAKPVDFYKDPGMGALKIGRTLLLLGDTARGRLWGDTALLFASRQVQEFPDDAQIAEVRGRANALAGHRAEAIADAERSLALRETKNDAVFGPYYRFQVARILLQAGENERSLDLLEPLLTIPAGMLTPAWLRLDPNFAPLRGNPRFQRMTGPK